MTLVDHHCHLDFPALAEDRDGVIARARAVGVGTLVTIGTRVRRFAEVLAIAAAHDGIYCSVGTHPHHATEERDVPLDGIVRLAAHPKVVAIGEAGLDYHYDFSAREDQEAGFRRHIAAARATGLPLVIHSRQADADTAALLTEETARGAFGFVLHCFTGGAALAATAIELGGYVSFSGVITFKKSEALRAIAASLPLDRVLVETDAPYLAPDPHRGKRNEPAFVVHTAAALAKARDLTPAEIAAATTANFHRLYARVPLKRAAADAA